jgi:hypothetical protein
MREVMRERRASLRSTNAGLVAETSDRDLSSDIGFLRGLPMSEASPSLEIRSTGDLPSVNRREF